MTRKKIVEHNALVQAVESGLPQAEVMEKFGLDSPSALKQAYFDGLVALEKIIGIKKRP